MMIWLNGTETEAQASTLDDLLVEFGYGTAKVATAVNGDFVPKGMRAATRINQGDRLEIVAPLQGG